MDFFESGAPHLQGVSNHHASIFFLPQCELQIRQHNLKVSMPDFVDDFPLTFSIAQIYSQAKAGALTTLFHPFTSSIT